MALGLQEEKRFYHKHFIPLESNPDVFTELAHKLGLSRSLAFQDVYSLGDPNLLAIVPRPAFALVLVFPMSNKYLEWCAEADDGSANKDAVVFFEQTINNACGLYALLHAVSNGDAARFIETGSIMDRLLEQCLPLDTKDRALALEGSRELESAYGSVARKGNTKAPDDPEDEVAFHYNCFVKSQKNGHLFLLDGDRERPVDLGPVGIEEDVLSGACLSAIRRMVADCGESLNFSLMALAPAQE